MTGLSRNKLRNVFVDENCVSQFTLKDWDLVVRQARKANLLYKLFKLFEEKGMLGLVPDAPMKHLMSVRVPGDNLERAVWQETCYLERAISFNAPLILLKGAAYVIKGLSAGKGRSFSDVDILVPKKKLLNVEMRLKAHGWLFGDIDEYDDQYYRKWMHELPPMMHIKRGAVVDVHHTILPETAYLTPQIEKIIDAVVPIAGFDNAYTLSPVDMVIHSAVHLFQDGELEHGMRDLVDLHYLIQEFSKENDSFVLDVLVRAEAIGLLRPVFYGLHYTHLFFNTKYSDEAMQKLRLSASKFSGLMDVLFIRALMPDHSSCDDWFTPIARWMLFVRAHYLRMPLRLLIPHLLKKAYKTRQKENKKKHAE